MTSTTTAANGHNEKSPSCSGKTCPVMGASQRPIWLKNEATERDQFDTLHQKAVKSIRCESGHCTAAIMAGQTVPRTPDGPRDPREVLPLAMEYLSEYYQHLQLENTAEHLGRIKQVQDEISNRGTYDLTRAELEYGARLAWRNSARCIARMHWTKLELFDCRHVTTTQEMYDALIRHLVYATNGGNIRVAITLFPHRVHGREDFRMWNSQFISYAGYERPDGTFMGDPQNVAFTKVCQKLGWKGKGGRFDVLPLVVSAPGEGPRAFEIPEELVLEVPLTHPNLEWFSDLGLKWYALPAVADMRLDIGGIEFTAAPFNGWYTSPEIATRNLCDPHRFNILQDVADRMGLDTSSNATLWKDRAMVQINVAVLHSYQTAGIAIVDHHTIAESHIKFMEQEQMLRGGCPSDWVWIVPPLSAGIMPTYHQEMIMYRLRPSYEYNEKAWKNFLANDGNRSSSSRSGSTTETESSEPEH